jgi:hypothetical protein
MMAKDAIAAAYEAVVRCARKDVKGDQTAGALLQLARSCLEYLGSACGRRSLTSRVPNKEYFAFEAKGSGRLSRPVNAALFDASSAAEGAPNVLAARVEDGRPQDLERILYTLGMSYCCAADVMKRQDRKTPGTFFEALVGHIVARTYGANPDRQVAVLNLDMQTSLPTDFVFDLGREKSRLHLPIKTSTRERVIQVWAHQRVLDGVYGVNRFRGILVCIAETNFQARDNSVIEVCLPGQWALYQMFIAQLHRVYYLDVPVKYGDLATTYPFIQVKPFAAFFREAQALISAPPAS